MFRKTTIALCALSLLAACEEEKPKTEEAPSAAAPTPPPAPEPAPEPEEKKEAKTPEWVEEYAGALCKRVAKCREEAMAKVPPAQQTMIAMQMPTEEVCLKNTRTSDGDPPKAELDDKEKEALKTCIESVPKTACEEVQKGKIDACKAITDLISPKKGE